MHLILDTLVKRGLDDEATVAAFIRDLVLILPGVHLRFGPHMEQFHNGSDYGPGITAIAIISESHIVVHTAPERGLLQLDCFSCKGFEPGRVKQLVADTFGISQILLELNLRRSGVGSAHGEPIRCPHCGQPRQPVGEHTCLPMKG